MELSKGQIEEIIAVFRSEASEHAKTLTEIFLNLEGAKKEERADLLKRAYREAHNLKGTASTLGFQKVATTTHKLEEIIGVYQREAVAIDEEKVDGLLRGLDEIRRVIEEEMRENISNRPQPRRSAPPTKEAKAASEMLPTKSSETRSDRAEMPVRDPREAEVEQRAQALKSGSIIYIKGMAKALFSLREGEQADAPLLLMQAVESAHGLWQLAEKQGFTPVALLCEHINAALEELVRNQKKLNDAAVELLLIALDSVRLTVESCESAQITASHQKTIASLERISGYSPSVSHQPAKNTDIASAPHPAIGEPVEKAVAVKSRSEAEPKASDGFVRIAEKTVDSVIVQVDELFEESLQFEALGAAISDVNMTVSEINRRLSALRASVKEPAMDQEIARISDRNNAVALQLKFATDRLYRQGRQLSKLVRMTQQDLHRIRLAPLSALFVVIRRQVREISRATHKRVELTLEGGEHAVDRRVAEAIEAPIVHILRNAIDHGIEEEGERAQAGKAAIGHIHVSARHMGEAVELAIADDGRGIDRDKIRASLKRTRRLSDEYVASLSDDQLIDFLFEPGFSTRASVSEISGRGVGMDVVKHTVEGLGGEVRLESRLGHGTRLILRLPLTVSTLRCLLVKLSQRVMAIPASNIEKILVLKDDEIRTVASANVIVYEEQNTPLVYLSDILQVSVNKNERGTGSTVAVVTRFGERRVAFIVDELVEYTTLVVKPLGDLLGNVPCISGIALLSTGEVALALNPGDLIRIAHGIRGEIKGRASSQEQGAEHVVRILVVDDSIATRTLEKTLLESAGFEVFAVSDGYQALKALKAQRYNLVISDLQMPNMDGFELTRTIKSRPELSHLPVILVTALGSDQDKAKGMAAGADAYLVKKQLTQGELVSTINQLL